MHRTFTAVCIAVLATTLWLALAQVVATGAGTGGGFSRRSALTVLLLIAAPAATFVPLSRWLRAPLYDVEGIAGWSLLGFAMVFITPSDPLALPQFLLVVLSSTVALATLGTILSYLVALRVLRGKPNQRDVVRARRQGYLAAFCVVALVLLHSIGTLSPTNAVLLLAIVVLSEMFVAGRAEGKSRSPVR